MNAIVKKIKELIRENIAVIIIFCVVLSIALVYKYVEEADGKKIYQSGLMSGEHIAEDIKKYKENEYQIKTIDKIDIPTFYYKDIVDKMVNNPEKLWDILTDKEKEKHKNDYKTFKKKLDKIVDIYTLTNKVKGYKIEEFTNRREIMILDSDNYQYKIFENGVNHDSCNGAKSLRSSN